MALLVVVRLYTRVIHVNPTTVALTFLVSVLIVSALWGLRYALFTAFVAAAAFNYYFLPPTGTFTVADTQNWVALFALLTTAVIASQLSDRARRQADDAVGRRRELERLYSFSQQLLTADNVLQLLNAVPHHVVESFGLSAAVVYVPDKGNVYRSGVEVPELDVDQLKSIIARGEPMVDDARNPELHAAQDGRQNRRGDRRGGKSFPANSGRRGKSDRYRGGACQCGGDPGRVLKRAREGERLRSAILDSVTHEFRTPLTSIKASITSLLSTPGLSPDDRQELMTVINEESDRRTGWWARLRRWRNSSPTNFNSTCRTVVCLTWCRPPWARSSRY